MNNDMNLVKVNSKKAKKTKKSYTCNICGWECYNPSALRSHEKVHSKHKPYQCSICLKCFSEKSYLTKHNFFHTGEKPFSCPICDRRFYLASQLKQHSRLHTTERPHQCIFCKKGFMFLSELKIHLRKHTNEKPYVCDVCQKAFQLRQSFENHQLTHSNEKHFSCHACSKKFRSKNGVRNHVKMQHGPQPTDIEKLKTKTGRKAKAPVKKLPPRQIFPKPCLVAATPIKLPLQIGVKEINQATSSMTPHVKMDQWRKIVAADQRPKSQTVVKSSKTQNKRLASKTAVSKNSKVVVARSLFQSEKLNATVAPKTSEPPLVTVPLTPMVMLVTYPLIQTQQVLA